jgi:hypothetical protein
LNDKGHGVLPAMGLLLSAITTGSGAVFGMMRS